MADDQLNNDFNQAFAPPVTEQPQAPAPTPTAPPEGDSGLTNVISPEGKLVSLQHSQVPSALGDGYQMASDDYVKNYEREQKYGTLGQQAKTAAEGFAKASTFGLSTGIETGLGLAKPEDIGAREETNPLSSMAGQAASFLVPGAPEATSLEHVGQAGVEALGIANAASTAGKIGSAATKAGIENMVFQGGDEVSKMLAQDPDQSVQTAIADVGLAGLLGAGIGGGIGTISPLWKATMGAQTGGILKSLADKVGGIEGAGGDVVANAGEKLGISISPEVKAALGNDPYAQRAFQTLSDSATGSGEKVREAASTFRNQMGDAAVSALGRTPEDVAAISDVSENEIGNSVKDSLKSSLKELTEPVTKSYEEISNKFKGTELSQGTIGSLGEKVANLIDAGASAESAEAKLVQRVLREIPGLKNLEQLRNYTSSLGNETNGIAKQELWGIGRKLQGALRDMQNEVLTNSVAKDAPHLIDQFSRTQAQYRQIKGIIDELNNRLHVGAQAGPKTFIKALGEMDGEAVLRRLSPKGKADIINELQKFPDALNKVRNYHTDQLLKASYKEGAISPKVLINQLDKLSPEMRSFVTPAGNEAKIEAIRELMGRMPDKIGKSGTPQALDALWSHTPGAAISVASMLFGHNVAVAGGVLALTKLLGRDAPDAVRLALLKFLGSDTHIESEGFKHMVEMIHSTIKGENLVGTATKNLFRAGRDILPQAVVPDEKDRARLDKKLQSLQTDPFQLMNVGGKTGHYMPEHTQALAATATTATNYVNSQRPNTTKASPLDSTPVVSSEQKAKFDNVLNIAQQPLVVVNKIANGTLSPQDLVHLKSMYPAMYAKLQTKLSEEMTDHLSKGKEVPYKIRQGLSLFMAQPLDSTMTPTAIQAAQYQRPGPDTPNQAQPPGNGKVTESGGRALNKMAAQYQTPNQSRAAEAAKRSE